MDRQTLITQIQQNAAQTPYTITPTNTGFQLSLNIVDAKWYTLLYKQGLKQTFSITAVLDENKKQATTTDELFALNWEAGTGPNEFRPHIGARINFRKGEVVSYQSHKEYGVSEAGAIGQVVNYTFDSREAKKWLESQLKAAGWSRGLSTEAKIGLGVGIGAIMLALGIGVGLLVVL